MSAGVPVICSNSTSMPEVGGDAVLYADPHKIGQVASAMQQIAGNPDLRKKLIEKGFEQKEKFSWDKTARLLWTSMERTLH